MQIRLSTVLQLFDGYRRRPIRMNEASFLVNHSPVIPVYKQNGYFVFTNLSPGPTRIDVLSSLFLPETLEFDVSGEPGVYPVFYRVLNPGRAYPYGTAPTAICGRFIKNGDPATHERILFYIPETQELLKVAQDDLEEGSKRIKLFSSRQTWRLQLPGKFIIADKDDKKREICLIAGMHDSENTYPLDEALRFSHPRATPLIELMEFHTAADGSFFMAVPERYETQRRAELEMPSVEKSWQVEIVHGRETNVGELRVES